MRVVNLAEGVGRAVGKSGTLKSWSPVVHSLLIHLFVVGILVFVPIRDNQRNDRGIVINMTMSGPESRPAVIQLVKPVSVEPFEGLSACNEIANSRNPGASHLSSLKTLDLYRPPVRNKGGAGCLQRPSGNLVADLRCFAYTAGSSAKQRFSAEASLKDRVLPALLDKVQTRKGLADRPVETLLVWATGEELLRVRDDASFFLDWLRHCTLGERICPAI